MNEIVDKCPDPDCIRCNPDHKKDLPEGHTLKERLEKYRQLLLSRPKNGYDEQLAEDLLPIINETMGRENAWWLKHPEAAARVILLTHALKAGSANRRHVLAYELGWIASYEPPYG